MIFTGEAADGAIVRYEDGKRHLYFFSLFLPVVPLIAIGLYYASGENPLATLIPLFFIFGFVPLADAVLGEDRHNPPPEVVAAMDADPYYRRLAMAAVPIFWASYIATAAFVGSAALPLWSLVALAIGVGTINGGCISVGHELGHKQDPRSRLFGTLANNVVGYAHFRVEHNRGHHTHVSTPEDPASSRLGESVYAFALRELPGAFKRGWRNEAERLAKRGKRSWSPENEILTGFALTLAVAGALIALFGWTVAPFILAHHYFGWYGLTQANYVEHYGLLRRKLPNGRYEPVQPRHSWNTNHIFSNLITFHLQRHSDHHANPLRPYQSLRHFEHLPQLPSGYPGCYVLAAVPPLWFKVMNPKVLAWAGGDVEKTNATPRARGRLASLAMPA
jgi:alkane 1-monooxygenase